MTIEERQVALNKMREAHHRSCPVCGDLNPNGWHVSFDVCPDGAVEAEVVFAEDKEGYAGHLHGGVIASLLDGAMTHCLFSHAIKAVTGELTVRMHRPLRAGVAVAARAWVVRSMAPLYLMAAELRQNGRLAARSKAKFMQKDG
ncbi:MAG: PaaI family thioesterase [Verrucomicrobia bacterium]|nr:PaaI family thioesterase [Verrucomicrobiota bacterium]MBT7068186.1 PaaI family thioesterase [Verrucomicrobiota bacterium]MBT7701870.1 PaaI family thioesterase [Verrucomicrobiota bacterium]